MSSRPLRGLLLVLLFLHPMIGWCAVAGVIQSVDGRARVWERSGLERAAQPNVQVFEGDTVATAAGSTVQLRMADGAMIWLRPDSQLRIDQYLIAKGSEKALLQLVKGGFRSVTGLIGSLRPAHYKAETANAAMGIRGTDYELVFVAPDQSASFKPPPGTYNRVHAGATWLSARNIRIAVNQGEAAFVGLGPQDGPRLLPAIPDFLVQPTGSASPAASQSAVGGTPREYVVRLRFGMPPELSGTSTLSSREASAPTEQQIRVTEGKPAALIMTTGTDGANRRTGAAQSARTSLELMATSDGNRVSVQLRLQQETTGRGPGSLSAATTVSLAPGQWEEVSGSAPFRDTLAESASSREARGDTRRAFLRIDEARR